MLRMPLGRARARAELEMILCRSSTTRQAAWKVWKCCSWEAILAPMGERRLDEFKVARHSPQNA